MSRHFGSNQWLWDASNPVALDEITPQELYSALKQGLSWDEYVHIFSMGAHEFILKEQVDKTLVVNYSRRSLQRKYSQSDDHRAIDGAQHSAPLLTRL